MRSPQKSLSPPCRASICTSDWHGSGRTRDFGEPDEVRVKGRPVCLEGGESLAIMKKTNLERHYGTKHARLSELQAVTQGQNKHTLAKFGCPTSSFQQTKFRVRKCCACKLCSEWVIFIGQNMSTETSCKNCYGPWCQKASPPLHLKACYWLQQNAKYQSDS